MSTRSWQTLFSLCLIAALLTPPTRAAEPIYPDTADGLKKLMEDTLAAVKAGDKEKASTLIKAMQLPDAKAWFNSTWGEEKGKGMANAYARLEKNFEKDFTKVFEKLAKDGRTYPTVHKIESATDDNASGAQKKAIEAMKQKVALYSVDFGPQPGETGFNLRSFVFVDGQFRFAGKLGSAE